MLRSAGSRHPTSAPREPFSLEALGYKDPKRAPAIAEENKDSTWTFFNAYVLSEAWKLETDFFGGITEVNWDCDINMTIHSYCQAAFFMYSRGMISFGWIFTNLKSKVFLEACGTFSILILPTTGM